ncbi:hypothetical protein AAF712_006136 [Marasmius tenuissimus]|uniref:DUF6699 domain-containing protein n=1 Tax=Marasmius tenuissimus TaxID=585030 RepID=A0ABR2ZZI6_9AGAR
MAPKTVRFEADTVVAPPPVGTTSATESRSSPAVTSSTPSSESEPATVDDQGHDSIIHDVLRYKSPPQLTFDVSKNPDTLSLLRKEVSTQGALVDTAITPPRHHLVLRNKYLVWDLEIQSSASTDDGDAFVSVEKLLQGLHTALQVRVTDGELRRAQKGEAVEAAFSERCKAAEREHGPGAGEEERRQGIKRVDFLEGHLRFFGLASTPEPGVFKFTVKK